ncbi:hypothetical protein P7C71_g5504, partial [Lecanoromycetidae sp. Uapishka_2]
MPHSPETKSFHLSTDLNQGDVLPECQHWKAIQVIRRPMGPRQSWAALEEATSVLGILQNPKATTKTPQILEINLDPQQGNETLSSPEGVASGQSEQLPFFKDYYSEDEIHPNDKVATLWAYQPRAGDEFELERGDMLKVVGIWDDGWATGVRIDERAEDYDGKHKAQRDSGVSNGSRGDLESPQPSGELKAFPLVCVCLPEYWRQTVDGDGSSDNGASGPPQGFGI